MWQTRIQLGCWCGCSANAGGKVEECHEFSAVFLQAQRRLEIFGLVGFVEQIECLLRVHLGLRLPDIVDRGLCLWLRQIRQAFEYVQRFMLPALLGGSQDILLPARQNPMAPSPMASLVAFIPQLLRPSRTSRQLCVDSRTPSSMARKRFLPQAVMPKITRAQNLSFSPRRPLWRPLAQI